MRSGRLVLCVGWFSAVYSFEPFPFYDVSCSFEENICTPIPRHAMTNRQQAMQPATYKLFDYPLSTPFGVSACAVTTSRGIALASDLGFSVLTYKTVRRCAQRSHDIPNLCYVSCDRQLTPSDVGSVLYATDHPLENSNMLAISNSVGNACPDFAWTKRDISLARACIKEGQVLIVSIYGEGKDIQATADEFAATARGVQDAGAQIIEINLSCPNVCGDMLYKDPESVGSVVRAVCSVVAIPVIIKVGLFESIEQMRAVFMQAASAGARGVCGINTVPMQVKNKNDEPYFGEKRKVSGLSGAPIRSLAQKFVVDAVRVINDEQLDFVVLATGGVTKKEHFQEFLDLGATIVLSASTFMYDPLCLV